jgi:hypothetical protein
MTINIEGVEAEIHRLALDLTTPRPDECLLCFVARQVLQFGCDTKLRWAGRFRDLRAPRATGLEKRLGRFGGFCDCEIFLNGWDMIDEVVDIDADGNHEWPNPLPECVGVNLPSTQPCALWRYRNPW